MAEFKEAPAGAPMGVRLMTWVDNRFPASKLYKEHLSEYYAPKNFNMWYFFGSLALLVLVIQIVTGIFLVMHYKPDFLANDDGVVQALDLDIGQHTRFLLSSGPARAYTPTVQTLRDACGIALSRCLEFRAGPSGWQVNVRTIT